MSGYLETYGAGEERRNRIVLWSIIGLLSTLILATILYFMFRYHSQEQRVESFLSAVKLQDYPRAFAIWGCGPQHPCRDYAMEKFMEDWGPKGAFTSMADGKLNYVEPCGVGLIYTVEKPGQQPLVLWTDSTDPMMGFAPWALCPEKGVSGITLRKVRLFLKQHFASGN